MRILITTGIFEPEAGGPATYTPKIARKLVESGHEVTVITYSDKERYDADATYSFRLVRVVRVQNKFSNYFSFFRATLREIKNKDIAYSLDWLAAGLPLTIAATIRQIPVVIRVGGDYIWEKYLLSGGVPMPLLEFYEQGLYKNHQKLFRVVRFVLHRAFVVFNSDTQRNMYERYFGLLPDQTTVIHNPMPDKGAIKREVASDEVIFAGRFIAMKNIVSLLEAFATARTPFKLVLIGSGPEEHRIRNAVMELRIENRVSLHPSMPQAALFERIKNSRALILPSWTDIAPNEVSEAIALGIPILVSRENFLPFRDQLPEMLDPASIDDIRLKLEMLADEARYQQFSDKLKRINFKNSWDDVVQSHLTVFDSVLDKKH